MYVLSCSRFLPEPPVERRKARAGEAQMPVERMHGQLAGCGHLALTPLRHLAQHQHPCRQWTLPGQDCQRPPIC